MSSKPVTPVSQRRAYPGENENTRIPQPFCRSFSLRMRTSRSFHDYQHYRSECCDCDCGASQQQQLGSHPSNLVMQGSGVKTKNTAATVLHGGSKSISHGLHQQQQQQQRSPTMATSNPATDVADEVDSFAVSSSTGKDGSVPNGVIPHGGHSDGGHTQHTNCITSSGLCKSKGTCQQLKQQQPSISCQQKQHERGMSLNLINSGHSSSSSQRTPRTPQTPGGGSGLGLQRAGGGGAVGSGLSPKTPPVSPESPINSYLDDDLDSLHSYSSVASGMSCDHPYVARNGTTFSGRKMKYVVHCSSHAGQTGGDYLTPTQRAQRQIRRLKELLSQARCDLEQRDSEILRLTKEVVELRLFKASLSSPEERSNSSDAVTVRENTTNDVNTPSSSQDISPIVDQIDEGVAKASPRHHHHHMQAGIHQVQFIDKLSTSEMQSSFADSGHFEDITTSSIHSKDSYVHTQDRACGSDEEMDAERKRLVALYEERIEELIKQHQSEEQQLRTSNNDRFEVLLQKLAESNTRYCDLVPDYEQAKERIRELEKQLEKLQTQLQEQEDKANKMYLHMYTKGQEAERQEQADRVSDMAHASPSRVSIPELMQQLQVTQDELENIRDTNYQQESGGTQVLLSAKEAISLWLLGARKTMYKRLIDAQQTKNKVDPEVTLQFLKSAIYYFLTDKENSQGHLNAIESILGFSDVERSNIDKARAYK
ncbi:protein quick-to-court isoform X1 [Anopheles gambiae]|uniref:protein quick-to-court isoform X1 n=1 Tax=Anopheles gambiae TaxID=7165 RepID=UPI002AC9AB5B|nr:protein quick-to-court isoform X1 [Anopheles gambiae]XP_061511622.1 protein quick-to-court isoform X1 [Anopheles gambiae]XP_061511623.1 protein quick-to-court isoform X1 [Anopheles gambiae]XP_061511624.1 protein quick-to-court isoform X1 [Anopheles gambiae]